MHQWHQGRRPQTLPTSALQQQRLQNATETTPLSALVIRQVFRGGLSTRDGDVQIHQKDEGETVKESPSLLGIRSLFSWLIFRKLALSECSWMFPIPVPICNCCPLPYLETRRDGTVLGKTIYVCDACCFVPKYDVYNGSNEVLYRIRPDTCVMGLCVRCRCDGKKGKKGKCCRVPFLIRKHPTMEALDGARGGLKAVIDNLWAGWKHECCTQKNAYHVVFPKDSTAEDKLLLLGSTVLVDVTMFEQDDNNDN